MCPSTETGPRQYDLLVEDPNSILFKITLALAWMQGTVTQQATSGKVPSGRGADFSPAYRTCIKRPNDNYELDTATVKYELIGDRQCGGWSTCRVDTDDSGGVCLTFTLQGHSEDGSARESAGNVSAQYKLKSSHPSVSAIPKQN